VRMLRAVFRTQSNALGDELGRSPMPSGLFVH
jgi:hypothetical protein